MGRILTGFLVIFFVSVIKPPAQPVAQQDAIRELSCALFPGDLTETDLIARFGRENVRAASVFGSDDGPQQGTIVFSDRADLRLEIAWWDPQSKTAPSWIRARGERSQWTTPNGIRIGMDLRTIERTNGWPFRLAGLSTEGQGVIRSWGNGRLKRTDTEGCTVSISLWRTATIDVDPLLARQVLRGEFSSGHPAMQALNPMVGSIAVTHRPRLADQR